MSDGVHSARVPGRVNLIGEHTDYNGGMVLPAALPLTLEIALRLRGDDQILIAAEGYPHTAERHLSDTATGHWSDPAVGAVIEAHRLGFLDSGVELRVQSEIPQGAGLSSSAALIVASLQAARASSANGAIDDLEIAKAARRVENDFIGVPCGIMDQMAVALADPGMAMAIDTKTLGYRLIRLPCAHEMVVIHSGLSRRLSDGRYGERKRECDLAKVHFDTPDLCSLDPDAILAARGLAEAPKNRALHCATEHRRVIAAAKALETGDMAGFGSAMNASHASMRDLFAMSLPPIDALVDEAVDLGAVGARLTGGGFGGCIVACIETTKRRDWCEALLDRHSDAHFVCAIGGQAD